MAQSTGGVVIASACGDAGEDAEMLLPRSEDSRPRFARRFRQGVAAIAVAGLVALAISRTSGTGRLRPEARVGQRGVVALDAQEEVTFDCEAGKSNWQRGWSAYKKNWCCTHSFQFACEDGASSEAKPFDCEAGKANWDAGWAVPKKIWCCQQEGVGCDKATRLKVTWVFAHVDHAKLKASGELRREFDESVRNTVESTLIDFHIEAKDIQVAVWAGSSLHGEAAAGKTRNAGVVVRVTVELASSKDHDVAGNQFMRPVFATRATRGIQGVVSSICSGIPSTHEVTVEPLIETPCTCENGEAAQCPGDGGNKCKSCDYGYHLTSNYDCEENVCTCHGGVPARGEVCKTHLERHCISCFQGRHYVPAKKACIANQCQCAMGFAATGPKCTQHHAAMCGTCYPGYVVDESSKQCVPKQCVCADGTPVDPEECPAPRAQRCKSCSSGFHVDPDDFTCKVNVCTCKRGQMAVGPNCRVHHTEDCASCEKDLYLHEGRCSGDRTCHCLNGTAVTGKKCTTNYATICSRCDLGFTLYQEQCVADRCVCENGVAAESAACASQGGAACKECNDGYHLQDGKCVSRHCKCEHGVGAKGKQCAEEGTHSCSECDAGYHQKLLTVEDTERHMQRLAVLCKPNHCKCEDGDGNHVGIAAAGDHQSKCFQDGANICVSCGSHFRGPDNKHRCIANACQCSHGEPVDVKDCHKDGLVNCKKCHDGYWLAHNSSWKQDPQYAGSIDKKTFEGMWKQGGSVCLPHSITSVQPFDCHAAQANWELAWSAAKRHWCCREKQIGCIPTETAKDACEGMGFTYEQCASVGCCSFVHGECAARKGWENDVCKPDFKVVSDLLGLCVKAVSAILPNELTTVLEQCVTSEPMQAWRPNKAHQIHNGANQCLGFASRIVGARQIVTQCVKENEIGHDKQLFDYDNVGKKLHVYPVGSPDLCVSTKGSGGGCMHPQKCVYLQECDLDDPAQKWAVSVLET